MVNNMNLNSTYNVTFNFTTCLPNPNKPEYSTAAVIIFLYCIALFCTLLQGYGLRLRRKIASIFYPEQEVARIHYLHEKSSMEDWRLEHGWKSSCSGSGRKTKSWSAWHSADFWPVASGALRSIVPAYCRREGHVTAAISSLAAVESLRNV